MRQGKWMVQRSPKVHYFKEICQLPSLVAPTAGNGSGLVTYHLNDLANAAHFKQLFDLYKITGVKLKIIPRFNVGEVSVGNTSGQGGNLPVLYIAPNRDPYVPAPGGIQDILNDDGVKIIRLTRPISMYLKSPKATIQNSGGDVPFQFGTSSAFQPWLTTGGNGQVVDQSSTAHYGHRWFISNGNGNLEVVLDVYATYYFCMKEQD